MSKKVENKIEERLPTEKSPEFLAEKEKSVEESEIRNEKDSKKEKSDTRSRKKEVAESEDGSYFDKLQIKSRLGFKSKLDLALRHAIRKLENETSKISGLDVEVLRKEFFLLTRKNSIQEHLYLVPIQIIMFDYRSFLISTIAFHKRNREKKRL